MVRKAKSSVTPSVLVTTLREELATARRLEEKYLRKIEELSTGSLVIRKLRHQKYAYLNRRQGHRVVQQYVGKATDELVKAHNATREEREAYRQKLENVREQARMLERALRGKAK